MMDKFHFLKLFNSNENKQYNAQNANANNWQNYSMVKCKLAILQKWQKCKQLQRQKWTLLNKITVTSLLFFKNAMTDNVSIWHATNAAAALSCFCSLYHFWKKFFCSFCHFGKISSIFALAEKHSNMIVAILWACWIKLMQNSKLSVLKNIQILAKIWIWQLWKWAIDFQIVLLSDFCVMPCQYFAINFGFHICSLQLWRGKLMSISM